VKASAPAPTRRNPAARRPELPRSKSPRGPSSTRLNRMLLEGRKNEPTLLDRSLSTAPRPMRRNWSRSPRTRPSDPEGGSAASDISPDVYSGAIPGSHPVAAAMSARAYGLVRPEVFSNGRRETDDGVFASASGERIDAGDDGRGPPDERAKSRSDRWLVGRTSQTAPETDIVGARIVGPLYHDFGG
jgi:hypothetical protein